jgi:rare lipoprotein A
MTASLIASPTVKREITAKSDASTGHATVKRHWFQLGKASWYGVGFNGKKTANGEIYDMFAMTCAHRTLPLGTWVRVTNLSNRKTVLLRVNDRGPVPTSVAVDLSYGAAQQLGIDGLAKVRIEQLSPAESKDAEEAKAAAEYVAKLKMPNDPTVLLPVDDTPKVEYLTVAMR